MQDDAAVEIVLAALGGLLIAAVTTPVGVSGAVFLLPFQLSMLHVPSPAVTPTNLLYNVVAVPGALVRYRSDGNLWTRLTATLLAGTIPGVVAGALIRVFVLPGDAVFRVLVGFLLLPMGIWLVWRSRQRIQDREGHDDLRAGALTGLGLAAGVVGGVYGIGGGSLLAPVLVGLGVTPRVVAPAALAATFLTSCAGVLTYGVMALLGYPQAAPMWTIALACGLGGLVGGWIGAALQPRLPRSVLTAGLGCVSIALAGAYLITSW